jgi:hypothetical protein
VCPAHSYFWQKKLEAEISGWNLEGFYLYTFYQEKKPQHFWSSIARIDQQTDIFAQYAGET